MNPRSRSINRNKRARARAAAGTAVTAATATASIGRNVDQSPVGRSANLPPGKTNRVSAIPVQVLSTEAPAIPRLIGWSHEHQTELDLAYHRNMFGMQQHPKIQIQHVHLERQTGMPTHEGHHHHREIQQQQQQQDFHHRQSQEVHMHIYGQLALIPRSSVYQWHHSLQQLAIQNQQQRYSQSQICLNQVGQEFNQTNLAGFTPNVPRNMSSRPQSIEVLGVSQRHHPIENLTQHALKSQLSSHAEHDFRTTASTKILSNTQTQCDDHLQHIKFPDISSSQRGRSDNELITPPHDADPNPVPVSNSTCDLTHSHASFTTHGPVLPRDDVMIQAESEKSTPSYQKAAPAFSSGAQLVKQSSSVPVLPNPDLDTAPSLARFRSGSDGRTGQEDSSALFIRISSTDSAIEQTLAFSMSAPLPMLSLRKLLSCSSLQAEQQTRHDALNSINHSPFRTERGEDGCEEALTTQMRTETAPTQKENITEHSDACQFSDRADDLGSTPEQAMPNNVGTNTAKVVL